MTYGCRPRGSQATAAPVSTTNSATEIEQKVPGFGTNWPASLPVRRLPSVAVPPPWADRRLSPAPVRGPSSVGTADTPVTCVMVCDVTVT